MVTEAQREQYQTEGYFIADDAAESDMLEPLLKATKQAKVKVRNGEVD